MPTRQDSRTAPLQLGSVTTFVVLVNLLAFLALSVSNSFASQIDLDTLVRWGANDRAPYEQPWRLLTCTFLHADRIALLTNMWWLFWTGQIVQRRIGSLAFLTTYLLSAVGASLTSTLWHPTAVSVGASGAVWGVWGVLTALVVFDLKLQANKHIRSVFAFVVVAVVADLATAAVRPHVDTAAHLGGLLTGLACGTTLIFTVLDSSGVRWRQTQLYPTSSARL